MLGVNWDEREFVENALVGKCIEKNIVKTLQLLMNYYYIEGVTEKLKLIEKLLDYLKKYYKDYQRIKWEDIIEKMTNRFLKLINEGKMTPKLLKIRRIDITNNEFEAIAKLDDIKLEKIAFIMLVYAKISNIKRDNKDGWINQPSNVICKEARVNLKGIDKDKIMNPLYTKEYIVQRKHNAKTNIKICYVDEDEDSKIRFSITDPEGIIFEFLKEKGEKWKKCSRCNKWVRMKNNKMKYCKECAKKVRKENDNKYQKKKYKIKTKEQRKNTC